MLDYGANVSARMRNDETPLHLATIGGFAIFFSQWNCNLQLNASQWYKCYVIGKTDVIKILIDSGADINAKNSDGNTSLHCAAALGMSKVVQFLIEMGADINVKNLKDQKPLDLAEKFGNYLISRMIQLQSL